MDGILAGRPKGSEPPSRSDPMGRDSAEDWERMREQALRSAARYGRRRGWDGHVLEDVAQEALTRLWIALRIDQPIRAPAAWVERVVQRIAMDGDRGRSSVAGPAQGVLWEHILWDGLEDDPARSPETETVLRDLWSAAPGLFARFPPPCREIATLQLLRGWTRGEIVTWLRDWRAVSESVARLAIRRTHALVRALGRAEDPSTVWPEGWDRKKNRWLTTPPPLVRR